MLSTRLRESLLAFVDALHSGRLEAVGEWLRWSDLRQTLVAGVGVFGLAAGIMALISSDALLMETRPGASQPASAEGIVLSSADLAGADGVAVSPSAGEVVTVTADTENAAASAEPAGEVVVPADDPAVVTIADEESTSNAPKDAIAEVAMAPAEEVDLIVPAEESEWQPGDEAVDLAFVFLIPESTDAQETSDLRFALRTAAAPAPAEPETTAALSEVVIETVPESIETTPAEAGEESGSAVRTEVVECPRDWVEAPGAEAPAASNCESLTALLRPSASADDLTALEEAASEEAEIIEAALPRVPKPRPEPTPDMLPVRRVANHRSDWPASPPPNCGSQHAYWRFVDREKGTKEWYCR